MNPKHIDQPKLEHASKLTLLQLNQLKYDNKHTVITAERLRAEGAANSANS